MKTIQCSECSTTSSENFTGLILRSSKGDKLLRYPVATSYAGGKVTFKDAFGTKFEIPLSRLGIPTVDSLYSIVNNCFCTGEDVTGNIQTYSVIDDYYVAQLPTNPGVLMGDTESIQFKDGTIVNYIWDGSWSVEFVDKSCCCLDVACEINMDTVALLSGIDFDVDLDAIQKIESYVHDVTNGCGKGSKFYRTEDRLVGTEQFSSTFSYNGTNWSNTFGNTLLYLDFYNTLTSSGQTDQFIAQELTPLNYQSIMFDLYTQVNQSLSGIDFQYSNTTYIETLLNGVVYTGPLNSLGFPASAVSGDQLTMRYTVQFSYKAYAGINGIEYYINLTGSAGETQQLINITKVNLGTWYVGESCSVYETNPIEQNESAYCINTIGGLTPANPSNPTLSEVHAWALNNINQSELSNGTILKYYDPTPVYTIQPTLTINNQNLAVAVYDYRVMSCIINGTEFVSTPINIQLANTYVYNNSLATAIRNYFTANNIIGNVDDGGFTSYMDLIFYGVQGTTLNVSMTVEYSLDATPTTFVTETKTGVSNAVIAPLLYSCEEPLITYVLSDGDLITKTSSPSGIFYKEQSVVDAGTDKYGKVYRYGSIGIGMNKPKAPLHIYGVGDAWEPTLNDASIYLGGHGKKIYWGDNTKTPESGSNVHNLSLGEWNGDSDAMAYHAKTGHRFYVKAIGWDDNSSSQYPTFFIRNVLGYGSNVGKIGLNTNNPRASVDFGNITNPEAVVVNKDGMIIPGGTTADRPAAPIESTVRYNYDLKCVEYYNGTTWVCTESRPYKVYTALLTQSGTSAPVATVLENTLGINPTWSYDSAGYYLFSQTGAFPINKTVVVVGDEKNTDAYSLIFRNNDEIGLFTSLLNNLGGGNDNILSNTSIEIRIYP